MNEKGVKFLEIALTILIVGGLAYGVVIAGYSVKRNSQDIRVRSDIKGIAQQLSIFQVNNQLGTYLVGKCNPTTVPSCGQLTASWQPALVSPETATNIAKFASDIDNNQSDFAGYVTIQSDATHWTVSALLPSKNVTNSPDQPTICANDAGKVRLCTSFPNTFQNSQCPDTGLVNGKTFTCADM